MHVVALIGPALIPLIVVWWQLRGLRAYWRETRDARRQWRSADRATKRRVRAALRTGTAVLDPHDAQLVIDRARTIDQSRAVTRIHRRYLFPATASHIGPRLDRRRCGVGLAFAESTAAASRAGSGMVRALSSSLWLCGKGWCGGGRLGGLERVPNHRG